jgi:hypothetical protein
MVSSNALAPGRVPHVRPSVHGPNTMGEALRSVLLADMLETLAMAEE